MICTFESEYKTSTAGVFLFSWTYVRIVDIPTYMKRGMIYHTYQVPGTRDYLMINDVTARNRYTTTVTPLSHIILHYLC